MFHGMNGPKTQNEESGMLHTYKWHIEKSRAPFPPTLKLFIEYIQFTVFILFTL